MTVTVTTPDLPQVDDAAPMRAVHTTNFPELLRRLGASLLVTTYQAGKLVMVRDEGDHLNAGELVRGARRSAGRRAGVDAGTDCPSRILGRGWRQSLRDRCADLWLTFAFQCPIFHDSEDHSS
jgi:hypothetical protein